MAIQTKKTNTVLSQLYRLIHQDCHLQKVKKRSGSVGSSSSVRDMYTSIRTPDQLSTHENTKQSHYVYLSFIIAKKIK